MQQIAIAGALGLGLFYLYNRPTTTEVSLHRITIERPQHPINSLNVQEAMGPAFEGKRTEKIWRHKDRQYRDRVRPFLRHVRPNQSAGGLIKDLWIASAKAYENVSNKTNNIFDLNRNRIYQRRVTNKFQIARAL